MWLSLVFPAALDEVEVELIFLKFTNVLHHLLSCLSLCVARWLHSDTPMATICFIKPKGTPAVPNARLDTSLVWYVISDKWITPGSHYMKWKVDSPREAKIATAMMRSAMIPYRTLTANWRECVCWHLTHPPRLRPKRDHQNNNKGYDYYNILKIKHHHGTCYAVILPQCMHRVSLKPRVGSSHDAILLP